jgi:hypothetical protein
LLTMVLSDEVMAIFTPRIACEREEWAFNYENVDLAIAPVFLGLEETNLGGRG